MNLFTSQRGRPPIDGLRLFIGAVMTASLHGIAMAQAGPIQVDESKVPDWVRRQATSPMKIIISSEPARKAAPAKAEVPVRPKGARPAADSAPATAVAATAPLPAPPSAPTTSAVATMEPTVLTPIKDATTTAPEAMPERIAKALPVLPVPSAPAVPVEPELRLVSRVDPQLSRALRGSLDGPASVEVAFTVNPDGSVSKASVTSSSHVPLNRPTLAAVSAWRFEPIARAREHRALFSFVER